ncbi:MULTISPECIES: YafY family protein [unclassified Microbacterium]|uniref:helix-turn-helix transcriptional regulator n=1 Tax=unclassified Microbacterium TaxID=2609290 RepID=UPI0012F7E1DD|nr:YafY family protein [Microbacterium sp. MAH-37]MVQ41958.1 WYL domain-containing protein [Microbacterium sp. MAH-37]
MADTTARALRLLELLQSAQLRTVAELADLLAVDERTVRRDVARLIELGMPIEALRGRYGGYRVVPGRRVLPLMFTSEEVMSVFLRLTRSQAASGAPDLAAQTALSKMMRALPSADAGRIGARLGAISGTLDGAPDDGPDPAVMLTLADAVDRHLVLDLRYVTRDGTPSRRTVQPYGLVAHSRRWYLLAFDTTVQEERTFRVDRIRTARSTQATFTPPLKIDAAERVVERFADAEYRWRVVLCIRQTEEHIRTHLPRTIARLDLVEHREDADGLATLPWHRAEIHAESLHWLPPVIAALGCDVVIESPDELREQVRLAATRMLDAAGSSRAP